MLDTRLLRSDLDSVVANLARRGFTFDKQVFVALEERRKALQVEVDRLRNERNTRSKSIGRAKSQGQDIAPLLAEVESLGDQLKRADEGLAAEQAALDALLLMEQHGYGRAGAYVLASVLLCLTGAWAGMSVGRQWIA